MRLCNRGSSSCWDGERSLAIRSGHCAHIIIFPHHFDANGTPQGSDPSFVERFRVSDDGSRLLYELTATDNEVFTEPVTVTRDRVWRPGEELKPYECDETE